MRSANEVHGTNSKFIVWPDCASKSLDSSTSAFAGSQAAQQSVRSAAVADVAAPPAISAETAADIRCLVFIRKSSHLVHHGPPAATRLPEVVNEVRTSFQGISEVRTSNVIALAKNLSDNLALTSGNRDIRPNASDHERSCKSGWRQPRHSGSGAQWACGRSAKDGRSRQ